MTVKTGLWIDHRKAIIVIFRDDKATVHMIKSNAEGHFRLKGGARSSTAYGPQDIISESSINAKYRHRLSVYYKEIINLLRDSTEIYIFGPGKAKSELEKEIKKVSSMINKISGIETVDKMTDKQIVAKVSKYYN